MLKYKNRPSNGYIEILEENLILPEDLYKYYGKVLVFHNGYGSVVSGILESPKEPSEYNKFMFDKKRNINYTHEIAMEYFYTPESKIDEYWYYLSANIILNMGVIQDQIMENILYVAIPTKEELDFRKRILSTSKDVVKKRTKELELIVDNRND